MNVFQNILDLYEVNGTYHKTAVEAETEKKRLMKEEGYQRVEIFPRQATNINGEWHLLGNIISL